MNKQGTNRIYRRPVSLTSKKKKKKIIMMQILKAKSKKFPNNTDIITKNQNMHQNILDLT